MNRFLALSLVAVAAAAAVPSALTQSRTSAQAQKDDANLTRRIERLLEQHPAISSHLIDIRRADGTVTLSGAVDNLLAKEQAVAVAAGVPGVQQVVDQIDVKTPERSEAEIRHDVQGALLSDAAADALDVKITVRDAVVSLNGTVQSLAEKRLTEQVVKGVKGVRRIENQLRVEHEQRSAAEIERDIRGLLQSDARLFDAQVDVRVEGGRAILSGTLDTLLEKERAARLAQLASVSEVDTSALRVLTPTPTGRVPDDEHDGRKLSSRDMKATIEQRLANDPSLNGEAITVAVSGDQVKLRGQVSSFQERSRIIQHALVPGVHQLDLTELTTQRQPLDVAGQKDSIEAGVFDQQIEATLERRFSLHPRLSIFELGVEVDDGLVTLTGMVDNLVAKQTAARLARDIRGVEQVSNYIKVRPITILLDKELIEKAHEAIDRDPYLERLEVDVDASNGKLILSGAVDTVFEKLHAEAILSKIRGVVAIQNNLAVRGGRPATSPLPPSYYHDYDANLPFD